MRIDYLCLDQKKFRIEYECEQIVVVTVLQDLDCPPGMYKPNVHIHVYKQQSFITSFCSFSQLLESYEATWLFRRLHSFFVVVVVVVLMYSRSTYL